jgi:hypothetical protein
LTNILWWGEAVMNDLYYTTMYERKIVCSWFNPLNAELNPICHMLALLGAHPILHVSRIRVKDVWFKSEEYCVLWIFGLYSVSMCSVKLVIDLPNDSSKTLTYTEMNK